MQLCLWLWCCSPPVEPRDDPRRLIGETSLRARTRAHTQGMDALSERGWLEAGWWRESKAGRQEVAERIDSVRMLRGCLTASRTRIPLIRHIVKCNYRGGLSGPRITDPPWRRPAAIADCSCASIVSTAPFSKVRGSDVYRLASLPFVFSKE